MRKIIHLVPAVITWALFVMAATTVSGGEMRDFVFIFESVDDGSADVKNTTSYVGKMKTVVQDSDSLLVIDYRQQQLVEYHLLTGKCEKYYLVGEENTGKGSRQDYQFRQEMAQQLGTAEVEKASGKVETKGFRRVAITWGGQANLHRTVTPPSVMMYGRHFTTGRDLYLVDDNFKFIDLLMEYGEMRDSVLARNPLVRRLDISAQISLITGVPVQITHGDGAVEKFKKIKKGSVDSYPPVPDTCR